MNLKFLQETLQSSPFAQCHEFDLKMQQDMSLALESAEMCETILSECQKALDTLLRSLSSFSHASNMSKRPQPMAALAAKGLMLEIDALEDAWSKALKSADRAGEVSFNLAHLVQALRKENAALQEQVQCNAAQCAQNGLLLTSVVCCANARSPAQY